MHFSYSSRGKFVQREGGKIIGGGGKENKNMFAWQESGEKTRGVIWPKKVFYCVPALEKEGGEVSMASRRRKTLLKMRRALGVLQKQHTVFRGKGNSFMGDEVLARIANSLLTNRRGKR